MQDLQLYKDTRHAHSSKDILIRGLSPMFLSTLTRSKESGPYFFPFECKIMWTETWVNLHTFTEPNPESQIRACLGGTKIWHWIFCTVRGLTARRLCDFLLMCLTATFWKGHQVYVIGLASVTLLSCVWEDQGSDQGRDAVCPVRGFSLFFLVYTNAVMTY